MVLEYNPKEVTLICGGKIISGFSDNTFIRLERNEQAFNLKVGVDGEGTRSQSNNLSGKVTATLMQSSSSNDDLSAFAILDEQSGAGAFPLFLKDASGQTLATAATAWIQKFPDGEFGKEVGTRGWVIETNALLIFLGGNNSVG